jgi:hypothetical protein
LKKQNIKYLRTLITGRSAQYNEDVGRRDIVNHSGRCHTTAWPNHSLTLAGNWFQSAYCFQFVVLIMFPTRSNCPSSNYVRSHVIFEAGASINRPKTGLRIRLLETQGLPNRSISYLVSKNQFIKKPINWTNPTNVWVLA